MEYTSENLYEKINLNSAEFDSLIAEEMIINDRMFSVLHKRGEQMNQVLNDLSYTIPERRDWIPSEWFAFHCRQNDDAPDLIQIGDGGGDESKMLFNRMKLIISSSKRNFAPGLSKVNKKW